MSVEHLFEIRTLLSEEPSWHRTRLSRELCQRWGWRNEAGQLKDMACRTLLLKLQARGWIQLPARQRASVNGSRNRKPVDVFYDDTPLQACLSELRPLSVEAVHWSSPQARLFQLLLHRYHYLSHHNCVVQQRNDPWNEERSKSWSNGSDERYVVWREGRDSVWWRC